MPLHKTPRSVFWGWQNSKLKLKEDWCTKATHLQISSIIDSWVNARIIHCVYHLSIHLHPIFSHLPPCSRPVHYLQKSLEAKPHKLQRSDITNKKCKKCEQMWANATWPKKRWHWLAHFLASSRPHEKHKTRRGAEKIEKTEKAKAIIPEFRFDWRLWDPGIDRSMCQAGVITHEPGMRSSTSLDFVSFVKWCQILMVLHVGKRSWNFHILKTLPCIFGHS